MNYINNSRPIGGRILPNRLKKPRLHRDIRERKSIHGKWKTTLDRRLQLNLSNMDGNVSDVETPRRRSLKPTKPVRRILKQQTQSNYRHVLSRSQPHGDEASLVQSHTLLVENESALDPLAEVSKDDELLGDGTSETMTIAVERDDHSVDLDQSADDLDSNISELYESINSVLEADPTIHRSSSKIPTVLPESISIKRGFKVRRGLLTRFESLSRTTKFRSSENDFMQVTNINAPKYVSTAPMEVASKLRKIWSILTSQVIIFGSVNALLTAKSTAETIPKQAEISLISESQFEKVSIFQQMVKCPELRNLNSATVEPIPSIHWMYADNLSREEFTEGETDLSILDSRAISSSIMCEFNQGGNQNSFSQTGSTSFIPTSVSSAVPSATVTNYWMIVESPANLETEEISELDSMLVQTTYSVPQAEIRRLSMHWAMGSCLFMSSLFVGKCFYTELLRGDWLSILGIMSALCTVVLISFSRGPDMS